jgi:hypothetical protein
VRRQLVANFAKAAHSGAVGTGSSSQFKAPPGTPRSLAAEIGHIAREAFSFGYVTAMHQTFIMPIAVLGIAALSCLAIKRVVSSTSPVDAPAAPQPEASQAPV